MQAPPLKNDCFALPPGVDWTPVDQALGLLRDRLTAVVGGQTLAVPKADGRILATNVTAVRSNPPTANSAVDGYGFSHAAVSGAEQSLPLVAGRSAAGVPFDRKVPSGHAVRILTGAPLPSGVDTVIMQEDVTVDAGTIRFYAGLKRGSNTREAAEDMAAGQTVLPKGHRLGPHDIALLTAVGVARCRVFKPLRVGVLSTGDELRAAGQSVTGAQIFDANRPLLLAMLARWGMQPVDLGHVPDQRHALRDTLNAAQTTTDAILTTGGASTGDEDHVSALLSTTGNLNTWRIAMKPGRPLALGHWGNVPVFGLPGNPVAAFLCALIFARPALGVLAGGDWRKPQGYRLPAAFVKSKKPGRREYMRARITSQGTVETFKSEGSGRISGLSWADGLVELSDEAQQIGPGDPVLYYPYGSFGL